jgi:cell wall-associated NlpC family hydrolase
MTFRYYSGSGGGGPFREHRRGDRLQHVVRVFFAIFAIVGVDFLAGAPEVEAESGSRTVDNATEDRFESNGDWGTSSYGRGVHDEDYRFARPAANSEPARFKVEIPEDGDYAVYVRWPKVDGLNASVPVGIATASGVEWARVNQQKNGGRWVKLGVYKMEAGDDYSVLFSRETSGTDYVGADAVKVEKVANSSREPEAGSSASGSRGEKAVREAKKWSGVRYRLGGATRSGIDCSGLTMMVYKKFGISLPHSDRAQYRYGKKVSGSPKPGDLVFFNEHGNGISHVGIYAGNGKILHASNYYNKVTESQMKYLKGYVGAKRLLYRTVRCRPISAVSLPLRTVQVS